MTKIAAGFAALVLTVSGVALASGPVASTTAPLAPVKEHVNKVQAPTHVSGTVDTKAAPAVKSEVGKAETKVDGAVKKVEDKAAQGAAVTGGTPAPKTTTN